MKRVTVPCVETLNGESSQRSEMVRVYVLIVFIGELDFSPRSFAPFVQTALDLLVL